MKNKNLLVIIAASVSVLGIICLFYPLTEKTINNKTNDFSETAKVTLKVGEERKIGDLILRMKGIVEDSRCPINARCFWAGKVSADLTLTRKKNTDESVKLNLPSSYVFGNYLIKFIDIKPEKIAGSEIKQSEYTATFSIKIAVDNKITEGIISKSGVKGFVMLGPICPAQRLSDDSCNDRPIKAGIIVKDDYGNIIKRKFETSEDGSFLIDLPPGKYILYADLDRKGPGIGGSKPEYVTVEEGNFVELIINVDTGIR